jgi:hypothetical protein
MDPEVVGIIVAGMIAASVESRQGSPIRGKPAEVADEIYRVVRAKLANDPEREDALKRLEARPTSQARLAELAEVLQEQAEADQAFGVQLARLIEDMQDDPTSASFLTTVQGRVRVGNIVNISRVTGDVDIGPSHVSIGTVSGDVDLSPSP